MFPYFFVSKKKKNDETPQRRGLKNILFKLLKMFILKYDVKLRILLKKKKEHLTKSGFNKVLSIKSVFPKGLSLKLVEFILDENIIPIIKPVFEPSTSKLDHN